jgi:hypothetical protein
MDFAATCSKNLVVPREILDRQGHFKNLVLQAQSQE